MALAQGTRVDPLMICPTTAGVRTDVTGRDSIAYTLYEYGKRIATGELRDPTFFFAWWEPPDGAGPVTERAAWRAANPGLGDILSEADLASAAASVPSRTPEAEFRIKRLNQWVNSATAWLPSGAFEARAVARRLEPDERVVLGFDGSFNHDCTALVACTLDGFLEVLGLWERPPGAAAWEVPIEEVTERVLAACRDYRVAEIAADPYRWAREIQAWAAAGLPAAEFPTSSPARMVPACATFYDAVVNGVLTHSGHPALVRHVANAVVKVDRLGPRIVKEHRGSPRHIDLAVAAVAAYARATYHATEPPPPEPAILGLWRGMAAEAEAWKAAQLAAPEGRVCGLRFRTPAPRSGSAGCAPATPGSTRRRDGWWAAAARRGAAGRPTGAGITYPARGYCGSQPGPPPGGSPAASGPTPCHLSSPRCRGGGCKREPHVRGTTSAHAPVSGSRGRGVLPSALHQGRRLASPSGPRLRAGARPACQPPAGGRVVTGGRSMLWRSSRPRLAPKARGRAALWDSG